MQMTCPKCHGEMRVYERSGVTIDQCTECRGIFLDRGELEALLDAEASFDAAGRVRAALPEAASHGAAHIHPLTGRRPALRLVPSAPSQAPSWTDDDAYDSGATFDARYDPLVPRRRGSFLRLLFD
jgi:hypothetical protein